MKNKGFFLCDDRYYYCSSTNTLITSELKDFYFKYRQSRNVELIDVAVDADSMKSSVMDLKQIIFEVTQGCNLKCKYCAYESGEYRLNRSGSSKTLGFETANKVIDTIWDAVNKRQKKEITIGFYGGEPLLEFETIQKIVKYSQAVFIGWNLSFTITTNGTLLDDKAIGFLIVNNFLTLISLDGPQSNHDAKRVFRNGKGTHHKVVETLNRIKRIDSEYYDKKVTLIAVYSKDLPFEGVVDFFNQDDLVKSLSVNFGFVAEADTSYYKIYSYDRSKYQTARERVARCIKTKMKKNDELSPIEFNLIQNHDILSAILGKRHFMSLMGACLYDSRLFVDAGGGFHMCEKINDKFQFGTAEDGFDFEKMARIANDYIVLLKKNCTNCDVNYLCQRCYINFAKNGSFEMDLAFCKSARYSIKRMLEELIEIEEGRLKQGVDTNE